ncbi:hypothetical protein [Qipengyuania sp.]
MEALFLAGNASFFPVNGQNAQTEPICMPQETGREIGTTKR